MATPARTTKADIERLGESAKAALADGVDNIVKSICATTPLIGLKEADVAALIDLNQRAEDERSHMLEQVQAWRVLLEEEVHRAREAITLLNGLKIGALTDALARLNHELESPTLLVALAEVARAQER